MRKALIAAALFTSGCGTLIGNVKPLEEPAQDYTVVNLAKQNPEAWSRIDDPSFGDAAFESKSTGAVLSVISSCRQRAVSPPPGPEALEARLRKLSNELSRGMTEITLQRERAAVVGGQPALARTLVGTMADGSNVRIVGPIVLRTVVLQRNRCSYELVAVSPPEAFATTQDDFSRFVQSFTFSKRSS